MSDFEKWVSSKPRYCEPTWKDCEEAYLAGQASAEQRVAELEEELAQEISDGIGNDKEWQARVSELETDVRLWQTTAAQRSDRVAELERDLGEWKEKFDAMLKVEAKLREALKAQAREPDCVVVGLDPLTKSSNCVSVIYPVGTRLYTTPSTHPAAEPVAWMFWNGHNYEADTSKEICEQYNVEKPILPLYTSPAAERRVPEWQPIETAPRDGSWFMAWREHGTIPRLVKMDVVYGEFEGEDGEHIYQLTHWMPIPNSPKEQS